MAKAFLTARWENIIMANYTIDPAILLPYLPAHTELDLFHGKCYVSLVGFMFRNTKVLGFSIPFHRHFEEVNLRFYVKHFDGKEWKRGVVFIKEIVPKHAITLVANTLYGEHYHTMKMNHSITTDQNSLNISYQWLYKGKQNSIKVMAEAEKISILPNSEEEFITEHYWGYTKLSNSKTSEYQVEHPRWNIHKIIKYEGECSVQEIYGSDFKLALSQKPGSVFVADGSEIIVRRGKIL